MSGPALLLSDLHLPAAPSPLRDRFLAFLDGPARAAAAVYILGDLFEYWIGDAEGLSDHAPEAGGLRRLAESGVRVAFMAGNRDFMIGRRFAAACALELLDDPTVLELGGVATLLSHGDRWCTADTAYQRWRRFSRNPVAQALYRRLPESQRRRVAGAARGAPDRPRKAAAIVDVDPAAVAGAFADSGAARIIHGHTHRPAEHRSLVDGRERERIVLADWRPGHCEYLAVDTQGARRIALPV